MNKFIELQVADEDEVKSETVNMSNVGRIFPSPQNARKCMVELNYHSNTDAPVCLEINMPYETVRSYFLT